MTHTATTALVFPGQGSQAVGMGKELFDSFLEAKEVFQEVDEVLSQKLSKIIFEGPMDILTQTENTQPALMAASIAAFRVITKQGGKEIKELAAFVAGHSLGEYSALCAAGSLSLADTARLLRIRGNAMQQAVPIGQGKMAAVLGLEMEVLEQIAKQATQGEEICEIANDNSPGQVVLSGSAPAMDRAEILAKEKGAKRFLFLPVSAPFHSSMMKPAAKTMQDALAQVEVYSPQIPVIANVSADKVQDPDMIRRYLVEQVTDRVRWRESVTRLAQLGIRHTVEVGAGKVLTGLSKRIADNIEGIAVFTPADIENFLKQHS